MAKVNYRHDDRARSGVPADLPLSVFLRGWQSSEVLTLLLGLSIRCPDWLGGGPRLNAAQSAPWLRGLE